MGVEILFAVAVFAIVMLYGALCHGAILSVRRYGWSRCIVFAFFAAGMILCGGSKNPQAIQIRFALGLTDAGSSYDATECVASIKWTYQSLYESYAFKWAYRARGNDVWISLPDGRVSDRAAFAVLPVEPGTLVDFMCWSEYIAPVQVVTNGVYHVNGVMRSMNSSDDEEPKFVTPGIVIRAGEVILTPTERPPQAPRSINDLQN